MTLRLSSVSPSLVNDMSSLCFSARRFLHSHHHILQAISARSMSTAKPPDPSSRKFDDINTSKIDYSAVYKERTGVTSGLWRLRLNMTEKDNFDPDNPPTRNELIEKPPWQSTVVVLYDFLDNKALLNEYIRFDGGVRFEKILEDMDSLAGNVAEVHSENGDDYPISFVTASVDRIDMKRRFPMNKNLVMEGYPMWVGRSSIDIQLSIFEKENKDVVICTANFIMVARDGITGKSTAINPLLLDDEVAQQNFIKGRFDAQLRKEERENNLTVIKPASGESAMIHQFWLDIRSKKIDLSLTEKYVAIQNTRYENMVICQPQHLNRNGKIFGGYLMKQAYELGRLTAYKFIGGLFNIYDDKTVKKEIIHHHPQFVSSDEISFERPVSIGCIIRNEAHVACTDTMDAVKRTDRKAIMILVRTYIQEPGSSVEVLSNRFWFCYMVPDPQNPIRRVVPLTYEESMIYLQGKRAMDQTTKIAIRNGSTFAQYL